ncbi:hypothetical protein C8J57DRAFT_1070198 [Mycena rebaudengoi]|nr:hypothetical protein C8J57DRAFT_1070198 [Mycena rebaudengoi]
MRPHFLLLPALGGLSFVSGLRNVTLDDNGSSIIYSPGWQVSNDVLDFGGSLHFSNDSTVSASLTFRGVAIYLLAPLWSSSVGAQVAIDGIAPTTIDLQDRGVPPELGFGKETVASQVVWGVSDLPNTKHTVVISLPQTKLMVVLDGLMYVLFGPVTEYD